MIEVVFNNAIEINESKRKVNPWKIKDNRTR